MKKIIVVVVLAVGAIAVFSQLSKRGGKENITPQTGTPEMKLVALGSSLSRASNLSSEMQGENNEYSFSTGTKVESVFNYLKVKEKGVTATNLASPGANMQDIFERQLSEALQLNPKYITIDPAADIVSRNSIPEYKRYLGQILSSINPETTVMIFTYPNFAKMRTANYSSCGGNKVGVELKNLSQENILVFNQAIKETVKQKSNVILIDIYELLGPTDISDYDCLHINLQGQKKIAAEFTKRLNSQGR